MIRYKTINEFGTRFVINMAKKLLSCDRVVAISEFRKNPVKEVTEDFGTLGVLANNSPALYAISVEEYEWVLGHLAKQGIDMDEVFKAFKQYKSQ
ncbi:hypothetical protein TW74_11980 [Vibrio nigripulchritudo]|nr:hypothetical protein TW74_11980 [Vibrio nigripulchritudo]BDU46458.1 hypothetical protein TUMSATVNIG3_52560 [Vibrio nigripulchritudo]